MWWWRWRPAVGYVVQFTIFRKPGLVAYVSMWWARTARANWLVCEVVEERKRRSRGWGAIGQTGNCVSGGRGGSACELTNRNGEKKGTKKLPLLTLSFCRLSAGGEESEKGKFWPKVFWFVLLGEWMGNSVVIRHTALLVIPALPLRQRQSRVLEARRIRVYLHVVCHEWKCSTAWNSSSYS